MCTWEVVAIFLHFQWFSCAWHQGRHTTQLENQTSLLLPKRCDYRNVSCCQLSITPHWSFTDPCPSLALTETFLLSASMIIMQTWHREMSFLSQQGPGSSFYYRNFHVITFYLNQSLLRSPLLETLALVQWQRWPNILLSLTKLYTAFFLTICPWSPFS